MSTEGPLDPFVSREEWDNLEQRVAVISDVLSDVCKQLEIVARVAAQAESAAQSANSRHTQYR